jgi:hypothetical protein
VALIVAVGVTLSLTLPHLASRSSGSRSASASGAGASPNKNAQDAAVQQAAQWVSQQVSRSVIVACDPQMCSALEARGVPAASLMMLRSDTPNPLGADLVMATPTVRNQFGDRLESVYAPSVIAGFGSGPNQVNVQVVAPNGATAYLTALRQDEAARKAAGAQLLDNKRIGAGARARTQLAAGQVDSRLLILLPALAATHPIQILAFGDAGPEAGSSIPLCSADLSGSGKPAGMADASYLHWLSDFVRAQLAPFSGRMVVLREGGQPIVRVQFAKPSPLGLLTHR